MWAAKEKQNRGMRGVRRLLEELSQNRRQAAKLEQPISAAVVVLAVALLLALSLSIEAKEEPRWQRGQVLGSSVTDVQEGTVIFPVGPHVWAVPVGSEREVYAILTVDLEDRPGDMIYVVSRLLKWRWNKRANLTINGFVYFHIEKDRLILVDDDKKKQKFYIQKKIRSKDKPPADMLPSGELL